MIDEARYRAALELVIKLVALADSTAFDGERDVALRKAWQLARRVGIPAITHLGRRYLFDPPPNMSKPPSAAPDPTPGIRRQRSGRP
jgi:hypothetical protein